MTKEQSAFQNFFLAIVTLIISFLVLEVLARFYLTRLADDKAFFYNASLRQLEDRSMREGNGSFKKSYHRYLGFYLTPDYQRGKNRHNSQGYRGDEIVTPKPNGEFRIVCLGGSTTYTSAVEDYRSSYPYLLESELKERGHSHVKVINAGVPGWSSWESLINFQLRVSELEPDMVIVYHGVNDVHTRLVWPSDAYRGDNSGRSLPAATSVFMPNILEYSTLIRIIMVRFGLTRPHVDINKTIDRQAETYYADDFQTQVKLGTYPTEIFAQVSAQNMLAENPPSFFKRNVENITYIAQMRDIKTVLATFASSQLFADEARAASAEYVSAYREQNAILAQIAQRTDAYLFDFANAFPPDKVYYDDGRHVTEEGAVLKAKLFADFILQNDLLERQ